MSNNSPTLQQHTTDTPNTNDTNRHDQQRQRMPPIVVSNVSGSRSSSSSPLASSADPPQTVNKQAPTPPSTTSLSTLGQYLPISTSLPEGMQQVLPLHSPLWTDLLPLLALQQSVAPSPSQSARRHTASAPVTTSQPQEHAAQPESSSTTLNRQQSAKDISRQSATHKCISVTQAKGSNSNKGTFIRIPVRAIVKNASTTTNASNHDDDHRTATTNQSISATQASNNASTKKTSSKKKGATKKAFRVRQADKKHLTIAKKLARYGPSLKAYEAMKLVRCRYGLSAVKEVEDQHDNDHMNVDSQDNNADMEVDEIVNTNMEENDTASNSATDNVEDKGQGSNIETSTVTSTRESDDKEEPTTSNHHEEMDTTVTSTRESDDKEEPTTSTEQKEMDTTVTSTRESDDKEEPTTSTEHEEMDISATENRAPAKDMDIDMDIMDIETWSNQWKECDPEYCCICLKNTFDKHKKLVYCSNPLCEVVVHQGCYGIHKIPSPDEPWYCDRCEDSPNDLRVVCCALCPSTRGAFRRLKEPHCGIEWIHVACAVRFRDVNIGDNKMKNNITLPGYHSDIWEGHCVFCPDGLSSHYGGYCTCSHPTCDARAHTSCATQLYYTKLYRVPSFRCPRHRSLAVSSDMVLNPWEKWVDKRDDWLQRQESFGFVYYAWSTVMEPVYLHNQPSQSMIDESTKRFVQMISQHLVGFMKKELKTVDRARSYADRLKRRLCSTHVEASKLCKRVDKMQNRVHQVSFLRDKIRQYSLDIRGYMELILLQIDATRMKRKGLQNAAANHASSSATTPSRGRKRSLSVESYTTANDQPTSSPIPPPTTDVDKGKAIDNIGEPAQSVPSETSSHTQMDISQRPSKKRSKVSETAQPVESNTDKLKETKTAAMETETPPSPAAVTTTTIDQPTTTEISSATIETSSPSSSSSSAKNIETAKTIPAAVDAKETDAIADESAKSSVPQKEIIEEYIDKSKQETQTSIATTTVTINEQQQQPSSIEQPVPAGTEVSVPIVIDEQASDVENSFTSTVEQSLPPEATRITAEDVQTATEQPKDVSSKDNTQVKARRTQKKTKRQRKPREPGATKDVRPKQQSRWWAWVEDYTKGLRQKEETQGPLVCKDCGQHNIPEYVLARLSYNPDELKNPSPKPYGYTGTGSEWNPSVFIECMSCKDVYHCGCSAIPVKKYPSKSESFFCEDCLNGLEANNRYNSIGYGVENNMPEGPRRRARINYKE